MSILQRLIFIVIHIVIFGIILGMIAGYFQEKHNNFTFAFIIHMTANIYIWITIIYNIINI